MSKPLIVVFVHGWSVRNTETYGQLPQRLKAEAARDGLALDVRNLWLSKYISFHNEVRLEDIARAFEAALTREFGALLKAGQRLAVITHSTGGPVVREWLHRYYLRRGRKTTPLSHLIMLAPANFGSALAQLGKTRIARLKTWFEGVEPGLGVLDWLELGSPESWALNLEWLDYADKAVSTRGVLPFVITGQTIDRKIYDHVNAYTGEQGSDGVVRVAAANLNYRYVQLTQQAPKRNVVADYLPLRAGDVRETTGVPWVLAAGRSHSGDDIGIMRSVHNNRQAHPTVSAMLQCLRVASLGDYRKLAKTFARTNTDVMDAERVETVDLPGPFERTVIHDPCSMVIFRVRDTEGRPVCDFDLMLTAGKDNNPDRMPPGFFIDRQKNNRSRNVLTYYFNHARMQGSAAINQNNKEMRAALPACEGLGLRIVPYPLNGFVHYVPAVLHVSQTHLQSLLQPHSTTLVDVVLQRVVREGVFRLSQRMDKEDFTKAEPGGPIGG